MHFALLNLITKNIGHQDDSLIYLYCYFAHNVWVSIVKLHQKCPGKGVIFRIPGTPLLDLEEEEVEEAEADWLSCSFWDALWDGPASLYSCL